MKISKLYDTRKYNLKPSTIYKDTDEYKTSQSELPDDGVFFHLLVQILRVRKDSTIIYNERVYSFSTEELSGAINNPSFSTLSNPSIGGNVTETIISNTLDTKVKTHLVGMNPIERGKVCAIGKWITEEEYLNHYIELRQVCTNCQKEHIILGEKNRVKGLRQIPGSKNKFWACSRECKDKFSNKIKSVNGYTSHGVRKRLYDNTFSNIYGVVYSIYNTKEDKYYIGKVARSPFARWEEHIFTKEQFQHMNFWDMVFKVEYVVFSSGDVTKDHQELWNKECEYVKMFDSVNTGYNRQQPSIYNNTKKEAEEELDPDAVFLQMFGVTASEYAMNKIGDGDV